MSELILCSGRIASLPFYIESAELNIYSLEELCYYIEHNLYALDRELMTEELISFIEKELEERDLAAKLRQIRRGEDSVYQFFMTILIFSGYSGKRELQECDDTLKSLRNKSEFECRKIRADHYLVKELYARAITEYRILLESEDRKKEPEFEIGNVWHNLGCAYAGLFLFAEAEECFFTAAAKNQSLESAEMLRLCREARAGHFPEAFTEADPEYEKALTRAKERLSEKDTEGFYEELGKLIYSYKKEYRRNSQIL